MRRSRWRSVLGWTYSALGRRADVAALPQELLERLQRAARCAAGRARPGREARRRACRARARRAARAAGTCRRRARRSAGAAAPARSTGRARAACCASVNPAAHAPGPLQTLEMPTASDSGRRRRDRLDALEHRLAGERRGEQAERVLGTVDERARDVAERRRLERLGRRQEGRGRLGARRRGQCPRDDDGPGGVDAEAPCLRRDRRGAAPGRERVEEILDEVALGEPLDELQALEAERRLRRDRVGEVARVLARAAVVGQPRDEEAHHLVARDERRDQRRAHRRLAPQRAREHRGERAAAGLRALQLAAQLGERDDVGPVRAHPARPRACAGGRRSARAGRCAGTRRRAGRAPARPSPTAGRRPTRRARCGAPSCDSCSSSRSERRVRS